MKMNDGANADNAELAHHDNNHHQGIGFHKTSCNKQGSTGQEQ